ncbi:hypothetical protein Mapa_011085 [Marchantia paleacea]|nr:hypothetical protein Mapa_011085 [Marchantia paleacea]
MSCQDQWVSLSFDLFVASSSIHAGSREQVSLTESLEDVSFARAHRQGILLVLADLIRQKRCSPAVGR